MPAHVHCKSFYNSLSSCAQQNAKDWLIFRSCWRQIFSQRKFYDQYAPGQILDSCEILTMVIFTRRPRGRRRHQKRQRSWRKWVRARNFLRQSRERNSTRLLPIRLATCAAFCTCVRDRSAGTHSRLRRLQKRRQAEVFEVSVRAWKKRRHNSDKIFHSLIESLLSRLSRNVCTLTGTTDVIILPRMYRSNVLKGFSC